MPRRQQGRTPTGLGKALVNANHRPRNQLRADKASLHYADLTTLPSSSAEASHLASVTDRSELDEFLHSAIAAEETFEAEKQQLVVLQSDAFEAKTSKREYNASAFVSPDPATATSASSPSSSATALPSIPIPRRPQWTSSMSAEELSLAERDSFLAWRRQLASLEDEQLILMTPFEKNIEVWKQLWRVIDRCTVVATIVDARNPLLYRSEDMERYVDELGRGGKVNVLVVNKADYLSVEQRRLWVSWFDRAALRVVFWSAARSMQQEEEKERKRKERERRRQQREADRERGLILGVAKVKLEEAISEDEHGGDVDGDERKDVNSSLLDGSNSAVMNGQQQHDESINSEDDEDEKNEEHEGREDDHSKQQSVELDESEDNDEAKDDKAVHAVHIDSSQSAVHNSIDILTRDQLLDYFRREYQSLQPTSPVPSSAVSTSYSRIQIGFVGAPNVGKSSTINALMLTKRVTVGATPGKTKHFQTLNCEDDLTLCDCPGLVFPSFLASRAELVCNGVMPIDQMREYANYTAPVALMVRRVGAEQLRQQYSLVFPHWRAEEDEHDREGETTAEVEAEYRRRAEEVLNAHARMRGWMKDHGRPDESRSARVLLKDLFTGKLLYCYRPPGLSAAEVRVWKQAERKSRTASRIVGEWKGEDVEQDGPSDAAGAADGNDEDDGGVLASRVMRAERGKVNKHVMEQMLQDEYDDELALQDEDGMAGGSRAGQPTKKQLLRDRQRTKRRTGKAVKLKKTEVSQEAVQLRTGGLSEGAAIRMGIVQSSRDGAPVKLKGNLTR